MDTVRSAPNCASTAGSGTNARRSVSVPSSKSSSKSPATVKETSPLVPEPVGISTARSGSEKSAAAAVPGNGEIRSRHGAARFRDS